jgi:hypothetical protein
MAMLMAMVLAYHFVAALLPRIMVISGWMMRSAKKAVVSDLRFPFINQKKEGVKHPLFLI